MIEPKDIDLSAITKDQLIGLQATYKEGKKHLQYFSDTDKHFCFPDKRMKTFDTVYFERVIPQIQNILTKLGKL